MTILDRVERAERVYTRVLETAVVALLAIVTIIVSSQVVARGVFNTSFTWTDELARLCLAWLTFVGAAVVMKRGSHIKVELITEALPAKARALLDLVIYISLGFFVCLLLWTGPEIIRSTHNVSMSALGWPTSLTHLAPFVGAAAMLPYIVGKAFKCVAVLRSISGR